MVSVDAQGRAGRLECGNRRLSKEGTVAPPVDWYEEISLRDFL